MNLYTLFAVWAVVIGLSESFQSDSLVENITDDRIIGGKTARPGQFPYQVSIRHKAELNGTTGWFGHRCGGSIISRYWVISAAHCAQGFHSQPSYLAVAVGAHRRVNDGKLYLLKAIFNHREYNEINIHNDITLLRTIEKIEFNKFVRSIPLRRQFVNEGTAAIVSGYGTIQVRVDFFCRF